MWLEFNNFLTPSVGAEQGLVTIAHQNLTGHGDIASLQYGRSAGVEPQFDARYTLPLTAYDTTLFLQYRRNDFRVIDPQFEPLGIKSRSEILGATLRQPLYRTLNNEFALAVTAEKLTNNLTWDPGGEGRLPFFIDGAPNGVSQITALRFSQEWVHRTSNQVILSLSRFSIGI